MPLASTSYHAVVPGGFERGLALLGVNVVPMLRVMRARSRCVDLASMEADPVGKIAAIILIHIS